MSFFNIQKRTYPDENNLTPRKKLKYTSEQTSELTLTAKNDYIDILNTLVRSACFSHERESLAKIITEAPPVQKEIKIISYHVNNRVNEFTPEAHQPDEEDNLSLLLLDTFNDFKKKK
ncbi:7332_t:CDS:2 [Dentiscutata erythropus]|uniref:7332_t:CDS:1 n=1 Tax=Dentiscutata erythropus TaxID=1348616 RepID=A0A9N9IB02_9GLOM|nr:7332_t:CDS:2 [Dentiscutata erythropus]